MTLACNTAEGATISSRVCRKLTANLFLLLFSLYVLSSSGNTPNVSDDGIIRFAVTQRLFEKGTLDLPEDIGVRWGIRGRDGKYYTQHGLGQSLLAIPFYMAGRVVGNPYFFVSLLGPLASALTCALLFLFCLRIGYSLRTSVTLSLLAGLCTQIWPESKSPFDHHIETLFSLLSIYLIYTAAVKGRKVDLFFAGMSLGFAMLTRVTTAFWLFPFGVAFWWNSRAERTRLNRIGYMARCGSFFLAGLAPFLVFLAWYNAFRFGSILESGYSLWAQQRGFNNFSNPVWVGLAGLLISPGKGVLIYCPILILSIMGLKKFYSWRHDIGLLCGLATIFYLLFFSRYIAWHGDNSWGPRYLTFLLPYWLLPVGMILDRERHGSKPCIRAVTKGLVIMSFLIQLAGVMVDMNFHYFKLLRLGAIRNVETYSYPRRLYFHPQYSPLLDRFKEIAHVLRPIGTPFRSNRERGTSLCQSPRNLDFWWCKGLRQGADKWGILFLVSPFIFEIVLSSFRIRGLLRGT